MPVTKENKARYPKNWNQIAYQVKTRAGWKCEWCGVAHGLIVVRDPATGKVLHETHAPDDSKTQELVSQGFKAVTIIITTAHLNHIPEDCADSNLKALCQKCHNRWDAGHRAKNRKARARKKKEQDGQQSLFNV